MNRFEQLVIGTFLWAGCVIVFIATLSLVAQFMNKAKPYIDAAAAVIVEGL